MVRILLGPLGKDSAQYSGHKTVLHNAAQLDDAAANNTAFRASGACIRRRSEHGPLGGSGTHDLLIWSLLLYRYAKDSDLRGRHSLMSACSILQSSFTEKILKVRKKETLRLYSTQGQLGRASGRSSFHACNGLQKVHLTPT